VTTTVCGGVFCAFELDVEAAEVVDGVGGAIWLKRYLGGFGWLYACKNDSPGVTRSYMDAAGCMKEFLWLIWVPVTQSSRGAHNLLESNGDLSLCYSATEGGKTRVIRVYARGHMTALPNWDTGCNHQDHLAQGNQPQNASISSHSNRPPRTSNKITSKPSRLLDVVSHHLAYRVRPTGAGLIERESEE